jgi:hypothetical protein
VSEQLATTQEKIAMLTGACETLATDLAAAEEKVGNLQSDYDKKALGRLASGNAKGARLARQAIAEARADVDDLRTALAQTREYLRLAQDEQKAAAEAAAWDTTQEAGEQYVAAMAELQSALETLVAKLLAVQPLADQMVSLAPVRVRLDLSESQRVHDLRLYLTRLAGDRLGKLAAPVLDPQFLQRQPSLLEAAKQHVAGLMGHRTTAKTIGDAA